MKKEVSGSLKEELVVEGNKALAYKLLSSANLSLSIKLMPNASLKLSVVAISPSVSISVDVEHSHSSSSLISVRALSPKAHIRVDGMIGKHASKASTHISLAAYPMGFLSPNLEIMRKDISASHEAFIYTISEEDLFYLTSRGIPKERSAFLLLKSFIYNPLSYDEEVEKALKEAIKGGLLPLPL